MQLLCHQHIWHSAHLLLMTEIKSLTMKEEKINAMVGEAKTISETMDKTTGRIGLRIIGLTMKLAVKCATPGTILHQTIRKGICMPLTHLQTWSCSQQISHRWIHMFGVQRKVQYHVIAWRASVGMNHIKVINNFRLIILSLYISIEHVGTTHIHTPARTLNMLDVFHVPKITKPFCSV